MDANAIQPSGSIRDRRHAAGLSQEALARLADCSVSYVRHLEHGYRPIKRSAPKLYAVIAALDALDGPDFTAAGADSLHERPTPAVRPASERCSDEREQPTPRHGG